MRSIQTLLKVLRKNNVINIEERDFDHDAWFSAGIIIAPSILLLGVVMYTRKWVGSALFGLFSCCAAICQASVVYGNDFSSQDASGWSVNGNSSGVLFSSVANAASGYGSFLGEYGAGDTLRFSHQNSALLNSRVTLSFNFFAIRSWDGNDQQWGQDFFTVSANSILLLDKTFSNGAGTQTFTRADGSGAPMAGSSEQYSLGYTFWDGVTGQRWNQDSVYRLSFVFDSLSDLLDLTFSSSGLQKDYVRNDPNGSVYLDESWGIDNLQVSVEPLKAASSVPEPTVLSLLLLGLFAGRVVRREGKPV